MCNRSLFGLSNARWKQSKISRKESLAANKYLTEESFVQRTCQIDW